MNDPRETLQRIFATRDVQVQSEEEDRELQELQFLGHLRVDRRTGNTRTVTLTSLGAAAFYGTPVGIPDGLQNPDDTYRVEFWAASMRVTLDAFLQYCLEKRREKNPGYPFGAPSNDFWWQRFTEYCQSKT